MQNAVFDLTVPDVFEDNSKNLCNLLINSDDDDGEEDPPNLCDSLYYTETDFADCICAENIQNGNNLTIITLNVANLFSKLKFFKLFIENITTTKNKPDIIAVVETHISETTNAGYTPEELKNILPGYVFYHRGRVSKKGGGVGIFVSGTLSSETETIELVRFQDELFENIVVKIPNTFKNHKKDCDKNLIIAVIYRQPNNNNLDIFTEELEKLLKQVDKKKNEIVLTGDTNLDLLKYDSHQATGNYLDLLSQHKLLPRIVRPTRIKKQSATLIDHFFTRDNANTLRSGIINTEIAGNCGFTDHFPIFLIMKVNVPRSKSNDTITKSFFSNDNHAERKEKLAGEDWSEVYLAEDPNSIYDMIITKYGKHYHENKTTRTFKKRTNRISREPWMTPEILADIRRRDRLARKKDRWEEEKKQRNEIVKKIRKAEKDYLKAQIENSVGNIKRHWDVIKKVTNKTNNKEETVTSFFYKGSLIEDPQTNAENMNEYLANIGKETNESVGNPSKNATCYMNKHSERNQHELSFHDISPADLIEVCKRFTPKTSCDASGMQQNIILSDIGLLAPVLAHLVNISQKTGIFPEGGKIARVIPVYKNKGSKNVFGNYRPISLLPVFSKIIERLIHDKLFEFLVRYQILFESQYGFRSGRNTTHATLDFIHSIEEAIESNQYAIGVFCDLSKAFDTLNHDILLQKLDHYGIRGKANMWFQSYLNNRKQYVELNNKKSSCLPIDTGVPQGSILGPLLFLIYINDLPSASNLKCVSFADDSNLLIQGDNLKELTLNLTKELEGISDFFKANQLKLNAKKTKMVFFRKKSLPDGHQQMDVVLDGTKLSHDDEAEFLGTIIDGTLSWEKHCTKVANKISRNNGLLNRVKHLLPPSSLKLLYHSFILPHILYALPAWGGCSAQNKKRIITIQKRAIRTISKSYYSAHTEPRMKKLGLLKFEDLYNLQNTLLVHDCFYGTAPKNIKSLINIALNPNLNLRNQVSKPLDLKVPNLKSRAGSHSFRQVGSSSWNMVSSELRAVKQKERFKRAMKNSILENYERKAVCTNPRCRDKSNHACIG